VILHEPAGLLSDLTTNGALLLGLDVPALGAARIAARTAFAEARTRGVPLVIAGQSQAGGEAQLQAAALQAEFPERVDDAGFMTFNAAFSLLAINRLGLAGAQVEGVYFAKDLDPGVGPHALLANRVGRQIYIHPDGSAGRTPGDTTIVNAMLHPRQHFLDSFDTVSIERALALALADGARPSCAPQ
jgi:hypothetical protein